jgi:hypothetical protein
LQGIFIKILLLLNCCDWIAAGSLIWFCRTSAVQCSAVRRVGNVENIIKTCKWFIANCLLPNSDLGCPSFRQFDKWFKNEGGKVKTAVAAQGSICDDVLINYHSSNFRVIRHFFFDVPGS